MSDPHTEFSRKLGLVVRNISLLQEAPRDPAASRPSCDKASQVNVREAGNHGGRESNLLAFVLVICDD